MDCDIIGHSHSCCRGVRQRAQGEGLPPIYAISDLSRYIDARFGLLVRKLLLALVGLFGLMFSSDSVTPLNAFLVGYSLDSVVELFGTSLEQKSASQVTTLRKQLGYHRRKMNCRSRREPIYPKMVKIKDSLQRWLLTTLAVV